MQKKQAAGLAAAAAVFVLVGLFGALTNFALGRFQGFEHSITLSDGSTLMTPANDYVGVVPVYGSIMEVSDGYSAGGYQHTATLEYIDELICDSFNQALLLMIDSPGGTVYASDELYLKLLEYKEQTGRPIYAYMESTACSGAYYIAMAADRIYANRNVMTGSIGVILSTVNLSGLYEKLGIEEIHIASGAHKADGAAGVPFSDEARAIYQASVDESYSQFVQIVMQGRGMDEQTVRALADGRIYTAKQAKANGMIDEIAPFEDAAAQIRTALGDEDIEFYQPALGSYDWLDYLLSSLKSAAPKSDMQALGEMLAEKGNGVLMYHAAIG